MATAQFARIRIKVEQVIWIAFAWFIAGAIDALFLHAVSENVYIHRSEAYQFLPVLLAYSFGFALSGLCVGSLLIFYLKDKFRDRSFFAFVLINISLIMFLAVTMNIIGLHLYLTLQLDLPFFHADVWEANYRLFTNPINFKNLSMGLLLAFATTVMIQVNDKYGPGVFSDLLLGKYHRPREEERIFMFIDMRSSTTIAEQIGHIRFHRLLGEFFRDITDPIIYRRGEIYQYVGDEVVVSWKMKDGSHGNNCLRCFYEMQDAIAARKHVYTERYGFVPQFKAAVHSGNVTVGEIGVVKKDIVFSGDVLNTTARMQSLCNELGAQLLISEHLLKKLQDPLEPYQVQKAGAFLLSGKKENTILYAVTPPGPDASGKPGFRD